MQSFSILMSFILGNVFIHWQHHRFLVNTFFPHITHNNSDLTNSNNKLDVINVAILKGVVVSMWIQVISQQWPPIVFPVALVQQSILMMDLRWSWLEEHQWMIVMIVTLHKRRKNGFQSEVYSGTIGISTTKFLFNNHLLITASCRCWLTPGPPGRKSEAYVSCRSNNNILRCTQLQAITQIDHQR